MVAFPRSSDINDCEQRKAQQYRLQKRKILPQIGIGVLLALAMSLVLTVLPIILGFKDMVGNTTYTQTYQFVYQFIYAILGVALAEELVFRGYIFHKLLAIKNSKWFAIIISSLLFGLFHIFNGNIIQIFMTAFIGFLYCIFREKIKGCTLLSLIIAHGVYDAMIVLWVSILWSDPKAVFSLAIGACWQSRIESRGCEWSSKMLFNFAGVVCSVWM